MRILTVFTFVFVLLATNANARPAFLAESTAAGSALDAACKAVNMDCSYISRYGLIDLVYDATGKVMFDKASNPYTRNRAEDAEIAKTLTHYYIGTTEQNAKLARNIMANKHLFVNGKLTKAAAKKWKFVE